MSLLEERIKSVYANLTREERKAADYCLKNDSSIYNNTVAELAEASGTTQATWSRFSKSLGYSGLKGLKREIFSDAKRTRHLPEASRPFLIIILFHFSWWTG